jgi:polar amino acid transport system permease protein
VDFDLSPVWDGWRELAHGTLITIAVTVGAIVLGCLIGVGVGLGRLNPRQRLLYGACTAYLSVIRGTPLLVQLFIWFFGLPRFGINLPAVFCGVVGMGVYSGAYVSEIVRGAIQSIDRGQMQAALALGMPPRTAMRHVVIPQALVRMIPPLGNEFIALIKNSSLVSLLTIADLMHEGDKIIATSYRSLEVYLAIALVYFVLTNLTGLVLRGMERRLRVGTRAGIVGES